MIDAHVSPLHNEGCYQYKLSNLTAEEIIFNQNVDLQTYGNVFRWIWLIDCMERSIRTSSNEKTWVHESVLQVQSITLCLYMFEFNLESCDK